MTGLNLEATVDSTFFAASSLRPHGGRQEDRWIASKRTNSASTSSPTARHAGKTRAKCLEIFLGKRGMRRDPYFSVIRDKCLDCSHTASEVSWCTATSCALWPYRMGTNPLRAEKTEAQKAAAIRTRQTSRRKPRKAATEIEMAQSKWLVAAVVPGIKRQPLDPAA